MRDEINAYLNNLIRVDLRGVGSVLITGVTGQDGIETARLIKEYSSSIRVIGVNRRHTRELSPHISDAINTYVDELIPGDVTDATFIDEVIKHFRPDLVFHYAAQSFVAYSFQNPLSTYETNVIGTINVLNAVKNHDSSASVYFAGTSEMWGRPEATPQNESTPFNPRSPYAVSKVAGFYSARLYREVHKLRVAAGVTGNHEGEYRGFEFVTQKVATWAAWLSLGQYRDLEIGNLEARKDWGWAREYVMAFLLMMLRDPGEYVIGTGEQHTVRELIESALSSIGFSITWSNDGGVVMDGSTMVASVRIDPRLFRPLEADNYLIDSSKIRERLGWKASMRFPELVRFMVNKAVDRIKTYGY